MFGLKKLTYKCGSKNAKFDTIEKYSDNHMPITKSCFVDTSEIWNGGNKKNLRASDEAQSRLLRFFDQQPSKEETKTLI